MERFLPKAKHLFSIGFVDRLLDVEDGLVNHVG